MQTILLALSIIGCICLVLSCAGSLFLANRAMIPIQDAWQQQKEFIADASHELRTPLTVIQTNLEVVLSNRDESVASQEKWLNNIMEETSQMARLVNSLLFLARADAQQNFLKKTVFQLDKTVMLATRPFRPVAASSGIRIALDIRHSCSISGDEPKIKQLIGIILDNALSFTPAGGDITISLNKTTKHAVLSISDTGDGISPEHLSKIFDRFYQADKSRANASGSGLGLSIAKWIVTQHNGDIKVCSTLGEGTTFTITLPLDKKELKRMAEKSS